MDTLIWKYFGDTHRVHCPTAKIAREVAKWTDCKLSSIYYHPDGHREQDVIIPSKLANRAQRHLKSVMKK